VNALTRLCSALAAAAASVCTPPQRECAAFETIAQTICDVTTTVTETICDLTTTVTETICDLTQTITQTICDATTTVTSSVCDSFGSIPIIGGLICLISHVVSTVVCVASHVVSTVVCVASHVVSTVVCVASHVVSTVVCLASHVAASTACVAWTIVKGAACVVVGGVASGICTVTAFLAGPGPILRSDTSRAVESAQGRRTARARSLILATDLRTGADLRSPYDEEGKHVAYRLDDDGGVERAIGTGAFAPLTFAAADLPPFAVPPGPGALAVSYDDRRLGDWSRPPEFDMIAASGDRVLAKMAHTDQVFIGITADPYVHPVGERRLVLPQSYFKLDPEIGQPGARIADLVAHVRVPGDDERHPATERFPVFRAAFELGALTVRIPLPTLVGRSLRLVQIPISVRFFKGAGELGLIQMDAWFPPRLWQRFDLRPTRGTQDPPARYPLYEHVVYATNNATRPENPRSSVAYTAVLDLGVGLSHLHEQHDNRFGGELDCLLDRAIRLGPLTTPSDEEAYRFANGPIRDFGGWVDGTCIYYMLVQLRPTDPDDPASFRDAYAVLWADEQAAFTERWRVLQLDDKAFQSPFKPIVGIVTDAPRSFYPGAPFDAGRFWEPFGAGHVGPDSRMVVARQIVIVSGRDPGTEAEELYSIHFSWPTMDRTWRWRRLPAGVSLETLAIREDTTILVSGSHELEGEHVRGRWFQRYLPANGQETPSLADRMGEPVGSKPSTGYSHPWEFVHDVVATLMDREFSHFGVYEPVRSRIQLYRVSLVERGELSDAEIEATVWEDTRHSLRIIHDRLDWAAAARALSGGRISDAISRRTHPSIYNDPMSVRLGHRPGLDWILSHFDKRDDKLLPFDGVGTAALAHVVLSDRDNPKRTITIAIDSHHRNNVRGLHGLTVDEEVDAVSPPQVSRTTVTVTPLQHGKVATVTIELDLARGPSAARDYATFEEWLGMNIWRVKLGAWIPGGPQGALVPVILLDLLRGAAFTYTETAPTRLTATWTPTADEQRDGLLAQLLTPRGRAMHGTSVWFIGATGLASSADETRFVVAQLGANR
jgi:hypothetical protein